MNTRRVGCARIVVGGLLAVLSIGCGDESFNVRYAPDYPRAGSTVSIFGTFKDGRLSAESWEQLGPTLSLPFGQGTCETAYSDKLINGAPALASATDEFARANGVTDELLDQFGPMAKGDAILFITVSGHPPAKTNESTPIEPQTSSRSMRGAGRGGMGAGPSSPGPSRQRSPTDVFEVSAALFSVRLHRSVGVVTMTYTGGSVDQALKKFADRLAVEMPRSRCAGWNWDAHVDDEKIRKMNETAPQ
jgi:hypothetical protein